MLGGERTMFDFRRGDRVRLIGREPIDKHHLLDIGACGTVVDPPEEMSWDPGNQYRSEYPVGVRWDDLVGASPPERGHDCDGTIKSGCGGWYVGAKQLQLIIDTEEL